MKPPSSRRATMPEKAVAPPDPSSLPPKIVADFIKFDCPTCGNPTAFQGQMANKLANCPACAANIIIPAFTGDKCYLAGNAATVRDTPTVKGSGTRAVVRPPSRTVQRADIPVAKSFPAPNRSKPKVSNNAPLMVALSVGGTFLLLFVMYFVLKSKSSTQDKDIASATPAAPAATPAPVPPPAPITNLPAPTSPPPASASAPTGPQSEKPNVVSAE